MFGLGPTELIVIAVIIVILFGVGRISRIGGELGSGIREFRKGLTGKESNQDKAETKKDEL